MAVTEKIAKEETERSARDKLLEGEYQKAIMKLSNVQFEKLWLHRAKGRWEGIDPLTAFKLLLNEAAELLEAVIKNEKPADVWREAADVANFALMIAESHEQRVEKS